MATKTSSVEFIGQRTKPFTIVDPGTGEQVYIDLSRTRVFEVSASGAEALVKGEPELWKLASTSSKASEVSGSKE